MTTLLNSRRRLANLRECAPSAWYGDLRCHSTLSSNVRQWLATRNSAPLQRHIGSGRTIYTTTSRSMERFASFATFLSATMPFTIRFSQVLEHVSILIFLVDLHMAYSIIRNGVAWLKSTLDKIGMANLVS